VQVSGDQPTFDVFARLCEVDASGRSTNLADGLQRVAVDGHGGDADDGRQHGGEVEAVHAVTVKLSPIGHRFEPGTRVRVQVAGGAHPRYARNLGTPTDLADASATHPRPVQLRIHHDAEHPTAVILPVAARPATP
jgi:predicted acyl esterase